jgi:acetoin utilization deacetylase AcuC-like enzyme
MDKYREALTRALNRITGLNCRFLIVALGLDTAKGDPTGTWPLVPRDFKVIGRMIGSLRLPTIVIQEGGYRIRSLGSNARNFFTGLWEGTSPAFAQGKTPISGVNDKGKNNKTGKPLPGRP